MVKRFSMIATTIGLAMMALPAAAQSGDRAAENLADFDFMVETITENYAGYPTKVTEETRPALDTLTGNLRARAADASNNELTALMREWMAFFNDRHIGIIAQAEGENPAQAVPVQDIDEQEFRRLLAADASPDPIEGLWSISDAYRVGIIADETQPGRYNAVVFEASNEAWRSGMLKAEIRERHDGGFDVTYYDGGFGERELTADLLADGTVFQMSQYSAWTKEWPQAADPDRVARVAPASEMFLRPLGEDTLWLRLPDFNERRAAPLRDLLADNAEALVSTPNLIIDIRSNGGGSDFVYEPLLALLYTQPIFDVGIELRATPDNIRLRQGWYERLRAEFPDQDLTSLERQITAMREANGEFARTSDRPFSIWMADEVRDFPRRVAILIDNAGSSGESFILSALQSRKVTLFGRENSAGVLDFGNIIDEATPSGRHRVGWATSRSLRLPDYPIDPEGIAPDIRIPEDAADPIAFVEQWLAAGGR